MRKSRNRIQHAVLGVVVSCVLLLGARSPFFLFFWSRIQQTVAVSVDAIGNILPFSKTQIWLQTNVSLQKRVAQTELLLRERDAKLLFLQGIEKENEDLRASLASISGQKKEWVPAHLLYSDEGVSINVGEKDGVTPGSTLMYKGIYLGSVKDVSPFTSSATTVWTPGARFGVKIQPAGALCVLQVTMNGRKIMCLSRIESVRSGDPVKVASDGKREREMLLGYIDRDFTQTADAVSTYSLKLAVGSVETVSTVLVEKGRE